MAGIHGDGKSIGRRVGMARAKFRSGIPIGARDHVLMPVGINVRVASAFAEEILAEEELFKC